MADAMCAPMRQRMAGRPNSRNECLATHTVGAHAEARMSPQSLRRLHGKQAHVVGALGRNRVQLPHISGDGLRKSASTGAVAARRTQRAETPKPTRRTASASRLVRLPDAKRPCRDLSDLHVLGAAVDTCRGHRQADDFCVTPAARQRRRASEVASPCKSPGKGKQGSGNIAVDAVTKAMLGPSRYNASECSDISAEAGNNYSLTPPKTAVACQLSQPVADSRPLACATLDHSETSPFGQVSAHCPLDKEGCLRPGAVAGAVLASTCPDQSSPCALDFFASAAGCTDAPPTILLGTVEVNFLSGQSMMVPVHAGQSMDSVKTEACQFRPPPKGLLLQLLHPTGIIQGDEDVAEFLDITLTALFTRSPISDEARELLRRCSLRSPEDGCMGLMEIPFKLGADEIGAFVELLAQLQPRRLFLSRPGSMTSSTGDGCDALANEGTLSLLVNSLKVNLQVEELHMQATVEQLEDVAKLLCRCPDLRRCQLHSSPGLTAANVQALRSEMKASIII